MNEKDILATLYCDTCDIERKIKVVNPNTGVTGHKMEQVATLIKCRIDEESSPTLVENEMQTFYTTYTLFTFPDIDIKKGDFITVNHLGDTYYFEASKPFRYANHLEVTLELKER